MDGTPLRQYMGGLAPWLFGHESPGHCNGWSPLAILRLWIPLRQAVRPLALLDQRTLDRKVNQLAFSLPTASFLKRQQSGIAAWVLSRGPSWAL